MEKNPPLLFVSDGNDPVGTYGRGVKRAGQMFQRTGMEDVTVKLFPLARHEILNEINRGGKCTALYPAGSTESLKSLKKTTNKRILSEFS